MVFTTQDAIGEEIAIRDWMHASYPAPTARDATWMFVQHALQFDLVKGTYGPVPVFQDGVIPYSSGGGAILLDDTGAPTVHSEYDARFALSVPRTPMPVGGYPIVLYAHGTGGDYMSFFMDGTAGVLGALGFAVMGVDQIHHGARNPTTTSPDLLFFNISNPDAARDNNRQSALDVVQQARVVASLTVPASVLPSGPFTFNTAQMYFMGHSQGGLNGPIFMAIDDSVQAGLLSAASAVITNALVGKLEPIVIPDIIRLALGLPGATWQAAFATESFTVEHPIATLIQTWLEAGDPANYAQFIFHSPRPGFDPKTVMMTEGMIDDYAPPGGIEALAGSMFVPQLDPVTHAMDANALNGIPIVSAMNVNGNVAAGAATAGLLQYPHDGHFAIFDNPSARSAERMFFQSLYDGTSVGTVTSVVP